MELDKLTRLALSKVKLKLLKPNLVPFELLPVSFERIVASAVHEGDRVAQVGQRHAAVHRHFAECQWSESTWKERSESVVSGKSRLLTTLTTQFESQKRASWSAWLPRD